MKTVFFLILAVVTALVAVPLQAEPLTLTATALSDLSGFECLAFGFGGLVGKAQLDAVFTGLKTIFNNQLKATTGDWEKTAMEVPSGGEGEDYAWLSDFPRFRKWVGDKHKKVLEAFKYYVKNEPWETTIRVKRDHIEDDKLGIYRMQAQGAGEAAGELNDLIVDDLKNNAFTETGIDGQYFYDTDHEVNDASVSNKGTVALSSANRAAADASIGVALTAIGTLTDDEGRPLRLVPDMLEVHTAKQATANTLATGDKLDDGTPNPYKGLFTVEVNPGLVSNTQWMVHVTKKTVKPFVVQMRKKPVFVSQTSMENDDVFNKGEYAFGAEARATGFYAFWQLSWGSTGTT